MLAVCSMHLGWLGDERAKTARARRRDMRVGLIAWRAQTRRWRSSAALRRRQSRRPGNHRRSTYQGDIAIAAVTAFALELAMCVCALAWHGAVRRFRKTGRESRRRTVAFYCGFGFIPGEDKCWHGGMLERGMGGSEQCVIRLARALSRVGGWSVVVYNACGSRVEIDGVTYAPTADFDPWAEYAHVVVWRVPQFLLAQKLATALARATTTFTSATVTYWVHDGSNIEMLRRSNCCFRRSIIAAVCTASHIVFPSVEMLEAQYRALVVDDTDQRGSVRDRALTIPHGIPRYFEDRAGYYMHAMRRPAWILWPVSVERGLDTLLAGIERLHRGARGRDFRLFICHHERGYHGAAAVMPDRADRRIVFTGMLPPIKLAAMYRRCSLFIFPSQVPEAFCLSAWECMTHGVVPVAYGLGALASLAECGAKIVSPGDEDNLFRQAARLLENPELADQVRRDMLRRVTARTCNWDAVADQWSSKVFGVTVPSSRRGCGEVARTYPSHLPESLRHRDTEKLLVEEEDWLSHLLDQHDASVAAAMANYV